MSHKGRPKLVDDDKFTIAVYVDGVVTRSWHYDHDDERRRYMAQAREYLEGWYDGLRLGVLDTSERHANRLDKTFYAEFERVRDDLSRLLDMLGGKNA